MLVHKIPLLFFSDERKTFYRAVFMLDLCGEKKENAKKSEVFNKNLQKTGQKPVKKPVF